MSDLTEAVIGLEETLANFRVEQLEEARKRDIRIRTNRVTTWMAIGVGLVGVAVGAVGITQVHDANRARAQRTVAACLQANVTNQAAADKDKANFSDFVDVLVDAGKQNPNNKPADPKIIEQIKDQENARIQARADMPPLHRDCSPKGIAAYFSKGTK